MTRIWKETGFLDSDPWIVETDEVKADEGQGQRPLLSVDELIELADSSNEVGFGVLVKPSDDVARLEPYLYRIELIAVQFPAFNDGRGFSHASLLRERLGYANELRAIGDVLIDQVPLMLRCGFDSFAVSNATAIKRLSENRLPGIDVHYQPAARTSAAGPSYSWRRRSA